MKYWKIKGNVRECVSVGDSSSFFTSFFLCWGMIPLFICEVSIYSATFCDKWLKLLGRTLLQDNKAVYIVFANTFSIFWLFNQWLFKEFKFIFKHRKKYFSVFTTSDSIKLEIITLLLISLCLITIIVLLLITVVKYY